MDPCPDSLRCSFQTWYQQPTTQAMVRISRRTLSRSPVVLTGVSAGGACISALCTSLHAVFAELACIVCLDTRLEATATAALSRFVHNLGAEALETTNYLFGLESAKVKVQAWTLLFRTPWSSSTNYVHDACLHERQAAYKPQQECVNLCDSSH